MTNAEEALSILQQKEQEKQRTEVIKEARRQKKIKRNFKNIKKLTKTTKEIAAPSNILQIKSVYFNTSKHKCF